MHIVNDNAVQGCLSENYLSRKIIVRNIRDLWYLVYCIEIHKSHESKICRNIHLFSLTPDPYPQVFNLAENRTYNIEETEAILCHQAALVLRASNKVIHVPPHFLECIIIVLWKLV